MANKVVGFIKSIGKISKVPYYLYLNYKDKQKQEDLFKKYGILTKYHITDNKAEIGDFTYGIPKIVLYTDKWKLRIGKFTCISNNVEIIFGGQHHYERVSQYAFIPKVQEYFDKFQYEDKPSRPVVIGNDVWIGRNVTILDGVTIGDGAVIGTNCIVTKNVPPYAIVVGNPMRIIKYRFAEEQIQKLLKIQWWNWDADMIKERIAEIQSPKIDEFILKYCQEI